MRCRSMLVICLLLIASSVYSAGSNNNYISDNIINDGAVVTPHLTAVFTNIATDTSDYAPGDSVIITGGGFWASESVAIDITNLYNPGFGDNDEPWYVTLTVIR